MTIQGEFATGAFLVISSTDLRIECPILLATVKGAIAFSNECIPANVTIRREPMR